MFLIVGIFLTFSSGCSKDDEITTIDDDIFYARIGSTIIHCLIDMYNQNLAGQPTGEHNITASGPLGGTVVITGTTSYSSEHSITTTDLLLTMTDVSYTYTYTDDNDKKWVTELTLTGPLTYTGSFSDDYASVNHQSDNLYINGTVTYNNEVTRSIDMAGEVSMNRNTSSISVDIFGNKMSW